MTGNEQERNVENEHRRDGEPKPQQVLVRYCSLIFVYSLGMDPPLESRFSINWYTYNSELIY